MHYLVNSLVIRARLSVEEKAREIFDCLVWSRDCNNQWVLTYANQIQNTEHRTVVEAVGRYR